MSVPVPPGLFTEPPRGASAIPTPTPQASDPTVLANGQVIPRQSMPVAAEGNSFTVDLDAAPQVLGDLRTARDQLYDLRHEAAFLGKIDPGTQDDVSRDAAAVFGAVAVGGPGSLLAALTAGIDRLNELISTLETEIADYRSTEGQQVRRFDDQA
ncbi:hypothetical protein [Actinomycetospora termitidis]|uniref:PE domain-containing protein n=1 Tax=Actinomycetospora termitidis TaxID=3053470 RepID=A0ABT7M3Y7_9PSEU|nr:hypothetical protein [Actinomycetospora sp. Odt1-22]MDL5154472.1 hypothetical protein [Actinomycetospora sp. Odt1-22]